MAMAVAARDAAAWVVVRVEATAVVARMEQAAAPGSGRDSR